MKNIMVCVTQQKSCERLIKYGYNLVDSGSQLYVIHVAPKDNNFLNSDEEGAALDYLYEKSQEYGAHLTVVRSNNILETLVDLVNKNQITHVVLGASGQVNNEESLLYNFEKKIQDKTELIILPSDQI